jgi:hypothetical protein
MREGLRGCCRGFGSCGPSPLQRCRQRSRRNNNRDRCRSSVLSATSSIPARRRHGVAGLVLGPSSPHITAGFRGQARGRKSCGREEGRDHRRRSRAAWPRRSPRRSPGPPGTVRPGSGGRSSRRSRAGPPVMGVTRVAIGYPFTGAPFQAATPCRGHRWRLWFTSPPCPSSRSSACPRPSRRRTVHLGRRAGTLSVEVKAGEPNALDF